MGKLFKHIFKKDFKDIFWYIVLPFVFTIMFIKLSEIYTGGTFEKIVRAGLSGMTVCSTIAAVTVISNDYNRFYGKNAAFYSNIPIKASQITGARLLNYILLSILTMIILFFEHICMMVTFKVHSLAEIWETIRYIFTDLSGIEIEVRLILICTPLALIIANIMMIQASATIGSESWYRRFGKGAPFLIFVLLEVVVNYTTVSLVKVFKASSSELDEMGTMANNAQTYEISKILTCSLLIIMIVSLIVTALLYMRCVYSHNKKLSVK